MTAVQEIALTESRTLREQYADRTDVLDKVKALRMLPDDMHVTTEMVAAYYEVPVETIKSVVEDNREELESNGRRVLTGAGLREFASPFGGLANLGLSPKTRSLAIFTRRAVLNVGQLLRDSHVARQVRTYLLDTEAESRFESTTDLDLTDLDNVGLILKAGTVALAKVRELEAVTAAQDRELATARPKADYVDSFVNGEADATTIRVLANQLKIGEKELRNLLIEQKAVYRKLEGRRWSRSQDRMVPEYSWHAYGTHRAWFTERDQPEAPRYHNGQMRTTLYVTPVGKVKIADLVRNRGAA